MNNPTVIHTLARAGSPSGQIKFVHTDGTEHLFASVINDMTGCRMSWFDNQPPSVNDSLTWVRSVFKDIRAKASKVLEVIGDF